MSCVPLLLTDQATFLSPPWLPALNVNTWMVLQSPFRSTLRSDIVRRVRTLYSLLVRSAELDNVGLTSFDLQNVCYAHLSTRTREGGS